MSSGLKGEDALQVACMSYMRLVHSDVLAIHVPNGGKRNAREAKKLKRMGVVAGACDVLIFDAGTWKGKQYNGLAIELKVDKNTSTNNQKEFQRKLFKRNWLVFELRELDDFMAVVDTYLKP